jgi:arsenate reductase-like glutaredoxin family protein
MASGDGRRREKYNQEAIANSLDRLLEKNMKLLKRSIDETNQDKRQGKVEKTYEEFAYRIDRATYISLKALKYYYSRLGAISTKQYQICERRARERRIGLRQYIDSLDLPHDINKEYEKYILQEDLDDGKEWVLSKDIKEIVLSSAGLKEKTMIEKLQDFFSPTEDNNLKNVIDSSSQFVEEKGKENRGKKKKIDKDR